jgi:hypothetical protein
MLENVVKPLNFDHPIPNAVVYPQTASCRPWRQGLQDALKAKFTQAKVVVRPTTWRPMVFALRCLYGHIVDARKAPLHQPALIELPILIAIRPAPVSSGVVRLIRIPDSNPVPIKCPQLFNQPVVELYLPIAFKKGLSVSVGQARSNDHG